MKLNFMRTDGVPCPSEANKTVGFVHVGFPVHKNAWVFGCENTVDGCIKKLYKEILQ